MHSLWHDCAKFIRSTWSVDLPQPPDLSEDSAYNWCRISIKTYKQVNDIVISVPMPSDLDADSIRIVRAPRCIGLRLSKIGGTVWLRRAIGLSFDLFEPISWQVDDGLLFIRLPMRLADHEDDDQGRVGEGANLTLKKFDEAAVAPMPVDHRTPRSQNWLERSKPSIFKSQGSTG